MSEELKNELKERLRQRLKEAEAERKATLVHPADCECRGSGQVPQSSFSIGYTKCTAKP